MSDARTDPIAAFYEAHPYPPPVAELSTPDGVESMQRYDHHRIWPSRPRGSVRRLLVAGCGTSQAARHATRNPGVDVVGIDVSPTSIEHTHRLIDQHGITNLRVEQLAIEEVGSLVESPDDRFDHIVCTGVLHHLADPVAGLRALAEVLAPGGAVTLMVYAPHGRYGVTLLQEYCRLLGITPEPGDIADLVGALRELPIGHPISRALRETRDFQSDDALADALLNPRDRTYRVDELLELLAGAGLRFGRWQQQAPYLPDCGSMSETPHCDRLLDLPEPEQYLAMEYYRGTIDRHTVIAFAADDATSGVIDPAMLPDAVPIVDPAATVVDDSERLPRGAAAALLNRSHSASDLVLFVGPNELDWFRSIDGRRTVTGLGADPAFISHLIRHDLVVVDASPGAST